MDGYNHIYNVEIPLVLAESSDLYFTVESYYNKMVPNICTSGVMTD